MTLIEMLRANGSWEADAAVTAIQERDKRIEDLTKSNTNLRIITMTNSVRIVSLENLFRTILDHAEQWVIQEIARKALEGKND